MSFDLRIVFLVFLVASGVLFTLRQRRLLLTLGDLGQIVLDFFLLPTMIGTVATFAFLMARQDPLPLIRRGAYQLGLQQLVSFADAIPENLRNNLAVQDIARLDTDGDGFAEWVVFYRFDLQDGRSPIQAAIYDNDRGNPPVIFPYLLRPPNRDYLSEGQVSLELEQVINEQDENGMSPREILVWGTNELTIFRFRQNSEVWDFPRDAPPRYQPMGFFRGSGGVSFNSETKQVTVIDRDGFERSQLVRRSIYALNAATKTYWDDFDSTKLAAPEISTVDFFSQPPADILNSAFPEKIVLAFYASTCRSNENVDALCRSKKEGWQPKDFLAGNSEAATEFDNGNPAYFGLSSFNNTTDISVSSLRYYPQLETDPDLLTTGGGRDVVTGEQAQFNVVDIEFIVTGNASEIARYEMRLVNGQWKIARRLPLDIPTLGAPTQIPAIPRE